ncbi:MAG: MFS transporter [Bacteroidales bacterium]|nr:MFS transporter [Bacteroidales bacterium]MBQ3659976.1 MFS transporter [Bacteroidales bacterium]MBQ5401471.1 MFS transporter [Bacteroidales bacterium]
MENTNPTTQQKPTGYAWFVVAVLFIAAALNQLDRSMVATMRLSIRAAIPMTDQQYGMLFSSLLWAYGFTNPIAGFLADKFSRVRVIIISLLSWSVITWLTSRVVTYEQLLACRIALGISEACYLPAALALIMDYHKGRTQSRATGFHMSGLVLGGSLGFLGSHLATVHQDWSYAFSLFGIVGVAYTVFAFFALKEAPKDPKPVKVVEEPAEKKPSFGEAFKHLFTNPSFIYLSIFWGIVGILAQVEGSWLPTYYNEAFGLPETKAGMLATLFLNPWQIVGLLLGGWIADRWSKTNKYARINIPIIGICIAAPAAFFAGYSVVLWMAVGFMVVYGISRMFVDTNLMPIIVATTDKRYRATAYGMMNMFTTVIGGLGVYVIGILRDHQVDMRLILQVVSLTALASVVFLVLIKRSVKKKDNQNQ